MNDRQTSLTTAVTVLVVACLFVAPVAPIVAVGGAEAGASGGTVAVDEAAAGLTNDSPDSDAVDPGLRSANGTVQLVVRFEEDAGSTLGDAEPSGAVSTDGLRSSAADAQTDFETFAQDDAAVTVERSFWLANAMLVTVDTDRVPVDRLLDVRGVERVHENFEVELDSAAVGGGHRDDGIARRPVGGSSRADTDDTHRFHDCNRLDRRDLRR